MKCFSWIGIVMVMQCKPSLNLIAHCGAFRGKKGKIFSVSVWSCVVWVIWKLRNDVIFNNVEVCFDKVVEEIKARIWSWFVTKDFGCMRFSFNDWLANPRLVLSC
ncbi:hypothetical protein ACS0TY_001455 [Phlomoides rotata]